MNFTIDELIYSDTAKQNGINNCPNLPMIYNNMMRLVVDLLQPLRNYIKKPINVTSGYRCEKINDLVGGANNSQHRIGQAVDINVKGMTYKNLADTIVGLRLPFDQMIIYNDKLHVSLKETNNRKEIINYGKN